MPITISINSGKDFEPVSEGLHVLVLADIVDLGPEQTQYGTKDKVRFVYMADEADEEGRTKLIFEKFTKSLHEKARLRGRVKELLGRDLTGEELKEFDIETLIGAQKQAIVEHNEGKEGKIYANIKAFMKGTPKVKLTIPNDFTRDKDKAPDKRKGQYSNAVGGGTATAKAILKPATKPYVAPTLVEAPITDEDIPF